MVANYGHAEVTVDTNARGIPGQIRRQLQRAGKAGGESFSQAFDKAANTGLGKTLSGFRESFRKWDQNLKDSGDRMTTLGRRTKAFMKTIGNTEPMIRFRLGLSSIGDQLERLIPAFHGATKAGEEHRSMWSRLSHNTRQWTLIVAAVIGALTPLAGLSSAAGSGIFVLAGAFSALLTATVFSFVAFKRFMGDIEKVPKVLKPARKAFDDFLKTFNNVMDAMTIEAFQGTEEAWKHFGNVVKALEPGFKAIGKVVNNLIKDLAVNLDTGLVEDLNGFLEGSAEVLDRVVRMVGRLGRALLDAFNRPSFKRALDNFLGWLDLLIDRFSAFLTGPGFDEWLAHGESVFGALGRLLDTTGRLLNDLVTDETIKNLVDFIDNIDRFLRGGGKGILDFATELDIFGVIAEALADFGDALEPLARPMADFAEAIHDVLMAGIDTLAPIIEDIAEALAPFVQALADFMKAHPKEVADAILLIAGAFGLLKAAKAGAVAVDMLLFSDALLAGGGSIRKFDVGKLKRIAGGIAGIGLIAAGQLIPDSFWEQFNLESNLPSNVLTGAGFGLMFGGWGAAIGAGIGLVVSLFTDFEATMNDVGLNLLGTLSGGPLGSFGTNLLQWFAGLVPEEWATSDNPMEQFAAAFADSVENFGTTVVTFNEEWGKIFDDKNEDPGELELLLQTMLTGISTAFDTWSTDVTDTWTTTWDALDNPAFWDIIADQIGTWIAGIIDDFRVNLETAATEWGTFWVTINNPNFWLVIGASVGAWLDQIKSDFATKLVGAKLSWDTFWTLLPSIVNGAKGQVLTTAGSLFSQMQFLFLNFPAIVKGAWNNFWGGLLGPVVSAVTSIISWVNRLIAPIKDALGRLGQFLSGSAKASAAGGGNPKFGAAGMMLNNGPRLIVAGEAGPEALVPLRRPLSLVDPQVRLLSAIAQGKADAPSGNNTGNGRSVNIAEGAIVIQGVTNPDAAAVGVVNRIAERFAG
jgi:hypothetical protein